MDNAQTIIRKLMSSLDNSTTGGLSALDEAIRNCSGSSYSSTQDLIDDFITKVRDFKAHGIDTNTTLKSICGIDLTNSDTGAISGSDAGSGGTQTASSIVYEPPYTSSGYNYPIAGSNYYRNIGGVRVYVPAAYDSGFEESEQALASGLFNNGWIEQSLALIQRSYGLSLTERGAMPSVIRVSFYYDSVGSDGSINEAKTSWSTHNGNMTINMAFNIAAFNRGFYLTKGTDASGFSRYTNSRGGTSERTYWDRIVAHELVHAVMDATFNNVSALPSFFLEGSAELVQGADDTRASDIRTLINDPDRLRAGLSTSSTGGTSDYLGPYAGGYLLLRYFAQQVSLLGQTTEPPATLPAGTSYNAGHTTLIAGAGFSGTLWLDSQSGYQYDSTVNAIDASQTSGNLVLMGRKDTNSVLSGGSGHNIIWGGFGGNDILTGGNGTNAYWFGAGNGTDYVTNYTSNRDQAYLYDGSLTGITTSGDTVVLQSGTSSLNLLKAVGQKITIATPSASLNAIIGHENTNDTLTWQSDINYYQGSSSCIATLKVNTSTAISLANNTAYGYVNIDNVDASSATGSTVLIGSTTRNKLTAGQGGSELWGGFGGNDTLVGGAGHDRFWYGSGDGSDIIEGATIDDTLYFYDPGLQISSIAQSGSDLVLSNAAGGSLTVKNWTGASTMQLSDGSNWRLTKQGPGFSTTRL